MRSVLERTGRLFVYGTLMPGRERWWALEAHVTSIQLATARGQLWDTKSGYPAARFDQAGPELPGVVVTIKPEALTKVVAMLDLIEAEGVLYRRVVLPTSAGPAMGYEWIGPTAGFVPLSNGWPCSSDGGTRR